MEVEPDIFLGVLFLFLLLIASCLALLAYVGFFSAINVTTKSNPFETLVIAYKFSRGPYKDAGDLFKEVHSLVPDLKLIGVYYDCPAEVDSHNLRYVVGAILSEGENAPVAAQQQLLISKGYKLATLPRVSHAVIATFPFVNIISVFIAIMRVYPKINQYITERNLSAHPMIEIYEKDLILFVAPLARQDEFYVTEALEEPEDSAAYSDTDRTFTEEEEEGSKLAAEACRYSSDEDNPSSLGVPPLPQHEETNQQREFSDDESGSSSFEELSLDDAAKST